MTLPLMDFCEFNLRLSRSALPLYSSSCEVVSTLPRTEETRGYV